MAVTLRLSEASQAERAFQMSLEQFEQDTFLPDAQRAFTDRTAESTSGAVPNSLQDPNQELLVRDSRTNPRVLEYRVQQALESMRLHKLRYKESLSKKIFLELLRDSAKVTHEDNERIRSSILTTKEDLKRTKRELREEYAKIKEASIDVGQRAQTVRTRLDEGAQLARKIQEMRWELTVIRSSQSPDKRLTIEQINERLADQDDQLIALSETEAGLTEQLELVRNRIAELNTRLEKLSIERPRAEAQANQLHQMDMNERAEITQLCTSRREMIELYYRLMRVQPLVAASENELRIPFDVEADGSEKHAVILSLVFNPANRRLAGAQLIGSNVDIDELLLVVKETNDVPAFVRDVRHRVNSLASLESRQRR